MDEKVHTCGFLCSGLLILVSGYNSIFRNFVFIASDVGLFDQGETIQGELKRVREENNTLRVMLEVLSSKYKKIQTQLEETRADLSVPYLDTNKRPRIEFPIAHKPLQIFAKTHPKDNSLVCLYMCIIKFFKLKFHM